MDILNDIIKNSFEIEPEVEIVPEPQKLEYIGTSDNDIFTGNSNNELFDGKGGNDTLKGGLGNDTYIFGKGYGLDTVIDSDMAIGNIDTIKMKDIKSTEIVTSRNGNNLVLSQGTDKLTIQDYFSGLNNKIERIEFADGAVWLQNTINQKLGYNNVSYNLEIQSDSSFFIKIKRDAVTFKTTYSFANNELSAKSEIIEGQANYNNFVKAGKMNILNSQISKFISELLNSGLPLSNWKTELVKNADKLNELVTELFEFTGTSVSDKLTSTSNNTLLSGGNGVDTLTGGAGNDILIGGLGNDTLNAGKGNDTYLFGFGDGQDTITDDLGTDELKMLEMNPLDIIFSKNGTKLDVKIAGTTDKVTINNWTTTGKVEKISVGNGLSITSDKVEQLVQAISSFSSKNQGITWENAVKTKKEELSSIISTYYTNI